MDIGAMIAERMKAKKGASASADDGEGAPPPDDTGPTDAEGVKQDALDEMTGILGLKGPEADRFSTAMSQYVEACMKNEDQGEPAAADSEG